MHTFTFTYISETKLLQLVPRRQARGTDSMIYKMVCEMTQMPPTSCILFITTIKLFLLTGY